MQELTVLKNSQGLHSKIDPKKSPYSTEDGFTFLKTAVNVDITDGYRISRRKGYSYFDDTASHSLYVYNGLGYCVRDGSLYQVLPNLTFKGIRSDIGDMRVRYCGVGGKIYYSNTVFNGVIDNGVSYVWAPDSYVGPDTVAEFVAPPVCKHMTSHKGRLYLSKGKVLWYTEPFNYSAINKATSFIQFSNTIRMVESIGNLLIVCTNDSISIITGETPDDFAIQVISYDKMLEDTAVVVSSPVLLGNQLRGKVCIFTTQAGIFAILPDGSMNDLTNNRLCLPDADKGNAYFKDNFYTVLIDE